MDAAMARFLAGIEAGREQIPGPWEDVPACTVSPGEACDVDLTELAAMAGPDGLAGESFAQGRAADALRPGPVLSRWPSRPPGTRAAWGITSCWERSRRRGGCRRGHSTWSWRRPRSSPPPRGPVRGGEGASGCREGEFADAELAMELITTGRAASDQMEMAADLTSRLPYTSAGLAVGAIDRDRAAVIWYYTRFLSGEHAAEADRILAAAAPALRTDLLARRAAKLEMRLDPEGAQRRKEEGKNRDRRVEARREASGNASLAGRELDVADVMAAKAQNDADAAALRAAGMPGSLRELRALAYMDRLKGLNPVDRITSAPAPEETVGQDEHAGQGQGPGAAPAPAGTRASGTAKATKTTPAAGRTETAKVPAGRNHPAPRPAAPWPRSPR